MQKPLPPRGEVGRGVNECLKIITMQKPLPPRGEVGRGVNECLKIITMQKPLPLRGEVGRGVNECLKIITMLKAFPPRGEVERGVNECLKIITMLKAFPPEGRGLERGKHKCTISPEHSPSNSVLLCCETTLCLCYWFWHCRNCSSYSACLQRVYGYRVRKKHVSGRKTHGFYARRLSL